MNAFAGKTVVVTGAAGALGRAVASEFGQLGASLVLVDIDGAQLRSSVSGDASLVKDARLVSVNLLDADALSKEMNALPPIDVLCNIAGGFSMGLPVHETSLKTLHSMLDINASTLLCAAAAVVPGMIARGRGWIVNVGAGAALRGSALMGAYAASKSVVMRLTESMSAELREQGINVNCVLPSIINTPQNRRDMPDADTARWVSPSELAQVIVFLASPSAKAIHGACVPVSGLV